ncbi:tRNA-dihydrouridine synthase family protein [Bengtsoniella intestinalis]|uniref:tRNA dihydrouridine synthase n=1 Tax=Bengtsoniella intestinalis TaxID=3073143 RepID=UPI00391F59C7
MHWEVAPLEGITTFIYRKAHHDIFGGASCYYTPFFSPTQERKLSTKEARDLSPEHNAGIVVIPQVLSKDPTQVLWAQQQVAERGFTELNINVGCPSGTVAAKGKGSGMLADITALDDFLEGVFANNLLPISVKTRVGVEHHDEFPAILNVFNQYPIHRLTIHPRVQKDFYKYPVRPEAFAYGIANTSLPLTYNGDLFTVADVERFCLQYPNVETIMFGRGVVGNPALLRQLNGGAPATREELQRFTATLYAGYQAAYGHKGAAAQRMKELWYSMIHLFADNQKLDKKMRRLSTPQEYEQTERLIFETLVLK